MKQTTLYLSLAACAFALVLTGCGDDLVSTSAADDEETAIIEQMDLLGKAVASELAAARRTTAPYHDPEAGMAAGWAAVVSECVAVPNVGGMGYHYLNPALADGTVEAAAPEILLYAPHENGGLRLVGIEYLVPFAVEPRAADGGTAPELYGEQYAENENANGWTLHAWVWKHNPAGMFADFNPKVSCDNA